MEEQLHFVDAAKRLRNLKSAFGLKSVFTPEFLKEESVDIGEGVHRNTFCVAHVPCGAATTLYELFEEAIERHGDRPFLGVRAVLPDGSPGPFEFMTFKEAAEKRSQFGAGLCKLGLQPTTCVGVYAKTSREWLLTEFACHAYSGFAVALYDTLGPSSAQYIINHAEAECPTVRWVICMTDDVTDGQKTEAQEKGLQLLSFEQVVELGRENPLPHHPPLPSDLFTIMYTSGTSGKPKGVMLTHATAVAEVAGLCSTEMYMGPDTVHISYLPLAHAIERHGCWAGVHVGGSLGFFRGDPKLLIEDMQALKPTIFIGVPRIYQLIKNKIEKTISESFFLKRWLFAWAYSAKAQAIKEGRETPWWDALVFNKVKQALGGNVEWVATGGAPMDPRLVEFIQVCFCAPVLHCYGLTECFGAAGVSTIPDSSTYTGGPPHGSVEMKLIDVPDLNYYTTDKPNPRGEVCLRGPAVFTGYYKEEEMTKQALDEEGWFHSGDVGTWQPCGVLEIIDRVKNIQKLAQGEYVALEKLEGIYSRCPYVGQIYVYGSSYHRWLSAVVVPNPDTFLKLLSQKGKTVNAETLTIYKDEDVKEYLLSELDAVATTAGLAGFEKIKVVEIVKEPFTLESGLLTPSMKLVRNKANEKYGNICLKMIEKYEAIQESQ